MIFSTEDPETPALSGSQGRQVAIKISGNLAAGTHSRGGNFHRSKKFKRSARPRNRLAAIDYQMSFGSVYAQRTKRVVDGWKLSTALYQYDLTLRTLFKGRTVCATTYYLRRSVPPRARVSPQIYQVTGPGNAPRSQEPVQLRLMLEKGERRRAPLPASDHPVRPRGYI